MTNLKVQGLSAWHHRSKPVIHGISFTANAGKITAILGPNGAGKSTVLKAIVGLVPSAGSIKLNDSNIGELSAKERAKLIAYVPQRSSLRAGLRVQRVVELGRYAHWNRLNGIQTSDRDIVIRAMQQTQTAHLAERRFTELSGGEQQRVLLARAIATGAHALLLDEPTSALDVYHALLFRKLLRELRDDGYTILIVLHDLNEVMETADDSVLLTDGNVMLHGKTSEVITADAIFQAYQVRLSERASLGFELESA